VTPCSNVAVSTTLVLYNIYGLSKSEHCQKYLVNVKYNYIS